MFKINETLNLIQETETITNMIKLFREGTGVTLQKYFNYYVGRQSILNKKYQDSTKPCNKIVKNYCYSIVNNYLGYLTGLPITYKSNEDISELMGVLQDNNVENADSLLLRNALVYGVAYEMAYVDEEGKERFKAIDSRECIPVFNDTLDEKLLYMIRFYEVTPIGSEDKEYAVEVYDSVNRYLFKADKDVKNLTYIEETPHYFREVPFAIFKLNEEQEAIFDKVMSLQDAYNELLSSEVDDFQAFTDAYLVLKGTGIEEEDVPKMRENRILVMDAEDSAEYLTKNISDTQIENMLKNLNDSIHVIANSPDFNDEKFMATSGIAMRYKLIGFENTSSAIANNMTKALQKRIELIDEIRGLVMDESKSNLDINISRNLPVDNTDIINVINSLRGMLSDRTLLSLLPFVSNVDAEIEAIQEQKRSNMEVYSFGDTNLNDKGVETDEEEGTEE